MTKAIRVASRIIIFFMGGSVRFWLSENSTNFCQKTDVFKRFPDSCTKSKLAV